VCEEVANLSNLLPEFIRSILYKETKADDDVFALKLDETYRGAGRHLLRLVEMRKDEIRRLRALKLQPLNHKSGRPETRSGSCKHCGRWESADVSLARSPLMPGSRA
jgi:hypothetical protein